MLKRDNLYLLRQTLSGYLGDINTHVINEQDGEYRYLEGGKNNSECIVFLHGLLGTKSQWRGLMNELSGTHRVIALDVPGLSSLAIESQSNYDFYSLSLYLVKILTRLGIKKATFVGHCVGGNLAQLFQSEYPTYVDKLVLVSPVGMELHDSNVLVSKISKFRNMLDFHSFEEFNQLVDSLFYQPIKIAKLLLELRMKELIRNKNSIKIVVQELERSLFPTVSAILTSKSHRLIICGDTDIFVDKDDFKYFEQCTNVRFELFYHCGHVPFLEYPKKTDQLVRQFLMN